MLLVGALVPPAPFVVAVSVHPAGREGYLQTGRGCGSGAAGVAWLIAEGLEERVFWRREERQAMVVRFVVIDICIFAYER